MKRVASNILILILGVVLILIIANVAGFLPTKEFPERDRIEARHSCEKLALAICKFGHRYDQFPLSQMDPDAVDLLIRSDSALIAHLRGDDASINIDRIMFFTAPEEKGGKGGLSARGDGWDFVDPWGKKYLVFLDGNRDGVTETPGTGVDQRPCMVFVCSFGPDGELRGSKNLIGFGCVSNTTK